MSQINRNHHHTACDLRSYRKWLSEATAYMGWRRSS